MFVRCAFFQGSIIPGQEQAFDAFVKNNLVPLWTQFPGAREVRILRQTEADAHAPDLAMVLAIRYDNRQDIDRALASAPREQSRAITAELLKLFNGTVFHTIFHTDEYAGLAP